MSKLTAAILLSMVAALPAAQTHSKTAHSRSVSLDTVLSCPDDGLLEEVFKTDASTARFRLDGLMIMLRKKQEADDLSYPALLAKGFVTSEFDDSSLNIMPTDRLGHLIEDSKLPFCRHYPMAFYDSYAKSGRALRVDILAGDWFLNPNEVFVHADQFQFVSGMFSNSTNVYLIATKGRVSLQFICKPEGLKLYRATYTHRD